MKEILLALDIGGTKLTAATAKRGSNRWLTHLRRSSPVGASVESDLSMIVALAGEALASARPASIGISFGGPVDFDNGVVYLSHHVPGWEDFPLRDRIASDLGAPVSVDNDANAGALGEWRFGKGAGARSLLYVTVSTGVGGGWIVDGRPWRGYNSMAGEIGHTVVDPTGPMCLCGKRGCVERLASGPYLAQDARAQVRADSQNSPILTELANNDPDRIDARLLAEAADRGDPLAVLLLRRGAGALGTGIGHAINLMNPQKVIVGGGVAKAGEVFWEPLAETAQRVALPQMDYELLPARFIDDAPLWGALTLAERLLDQGSS